MWSSRKQQRRAERKAKLEVESKVAREEEARKEALSLYDLIQESDASADVKLILHRITALMGVEFD